MRRRGCSESHWSQFVRGVVHGGGGGGWPSGLKHCTGDRVVKLELRQHISLRNFGNFVYPALPVWRKH